MNWIELFFIAFGISLLGTIPIGLITLAITERSITKGFKYGFIIGLGATVMEFVYTYVAITCLDALTENISIGRNIKIVSIIIFIVLAILFLSKKPKQPNKSIALQENLVLEFFKGIGVGAMNFLIIPFWLFIGVWLRSNEIVVIGVGEITLFSIAAALGALVVFIGYGVLAHYISNKLEMVTKYTNKLVGVVFLILAIIQAAQLI
jgi:threonine/homoserine/homoserine lactone efflux protein